MEQTKWVDRKFSFDMPVGWMPNILERLRGASARLREITDGLTESETGVKLQSKWSIKEHLGHLSDVEELHAIRLEDFISRRKVLAPADMTNVKTEEADHNSKSIQKLLNDFSIKRRHFINRLQLLDEETQNFKSKHLRLNKMMRPVDLAFFVAEHDDHHMAILRNIVIDANPRQ